MFGAFNIQHLVVVSFLFLSLFEALFKARLFFSGQKKGGLNGYASIIHNIQTLFFLFGLGLYLGLSWGEGRGLRGVIYTRSFWSLFFYTYHYVDFGKRGILEEGQRLGLLA